LPRIGNLPLGSVKPKHIDDLILELREEGKLAPRTIRGISGLLHTMFKRAVKEELLVTNPVMMERGTLPKNVDADPTWRPEAIFTRDEATSLISDPRILPDRQVLYALKFLAAGARHGEASRLRWRDYDPTIQPLGRIVLGKTKSGVPRQIPVHPTLAKILSEWKLRGWREIYGRDPEPFSDEHPRGTVRHPNESQHALVFDLKLLGLRVEAGAKRRRRGHDLRRTFISLARADGALKDTLRLITHGPEAGDMMDLYTSLTWADFCAEIVKLKIEVSETTLAAEDRYSSLRREQSARNRWKNRATPTGFEPVLPA